MFADALYVGDASVERVYVGDLEVWSADPSGPTLPVVHITGTSSTVSRKSCAGLLPPLKLSSTMSSSWEFIRRTNSSTPARELSAHDPPAPMPSMELWPHGIHSALQSSFAARWSAVWESTEPVTRPFVPTPSKA